MESVIELAGQAGDRILEIYDSEFEVEQKADQSPLTLADKAAHDLIVSRLREITPELPVLSEEGAGIEYAERARWQRYWLIDPLDGTREFVNRNGEFTVNIGLIEGDAPVMGVVHTPVKGIHHWAVQGHGAYRRNSDGVDHKIEVRPYHGGRAKVVASRSHARGSALAEFTTRLEQREGPYDTINMGSALKLCLIAEGAGDVYPRLGPTSEWDTAAAQCVVEEAGGQVTDCKGSRLVYNKPSLLNPWFIVSGNSYGW
ncbi:MAG: 3'(2'),5'-bisphosphate nucleotidase CysQ, partial [Gammaproteobacteria bacterium]|nr:3'(2'),5'-bisphosphate nucleotidase CysQ [Gammaproteobacteria bacterium]